MKMPTLHSHTHCQAAQANATTHPESFREANSVSVQPHDQNDRQTNGRKRTPKR